MTKERNIMNRTKLQHAGRGRFGTIWAGAALLAGVALCPLTSRAQVTGAFYSPGPVTATGPQLTIKVGNFSASPFTAIAGYILADGAIGFQQQGSVPANGITDFTFVTNPGSAIENHRLRVQFFSKGVRSSCDTFVLQR
jgi:hypothetical protein